MVFSSRYYSIDIAISLTLTGQRSSENFRVCLRKVFVTCSFEKCNHYFHHLIPKNQRHWRTVEVWQYLKRRGRFSHVKNTWQNLSPPQFHCYQLVHDQGHFFVVYQTLQETKIHLVSRWYFREMAYDSPAAHFLPLLGLLPPLLERWVLQKH